MKGRGEEVISFLIFLWCIFFRKWQKSSWKESTSANVGRLTFSYFAFGWVDGFLILESNLITPFFKKDQSTISKQFHCGVFPSEWKIQIHLGRGHLQKCLMPVGDGFCNESQANKPNTAGNNWNIHYIGNNGIKFTLYMMIQLFKGIETICIDLEKCL